jgi:gliding-associated putative ABC transporter substrate-binding component GldG
MAAQSKKLRVGSNAIVFAAATVGVLVLVNFLSVLLPRGRVDLTAERMYTLSDASKQLVRSLPDRMQITAYITDPKDLPPPARHLERVGRYVKELLDEYTKASGGKLTWEAVDPGSAKDDKKRREMEDEAQRAKVTKLTLRALSKEKLQLQSAYLGISFRFGDAIESIPQVMSDEGLEYQISSIIKRMTVKKRKVAFTKGHGEPDFQRGIAVLKELLGREYDVTQVELDGKSPIPDDVDALLVYGPRQRFDDKAQFLLDQWLMKGKPLAFFVDGMVIDTPRGSMPNMQMPKMAQKNDVGLGELLGAYGFKINDDIVLDPQNYYGPITYQGRPALANFPTFALVGPKDLAPPEELDIMKNQQVMVFPYGSSVELTGNKPAGKLIPIARSTPGSWKQTGFFLVDPANPPKETSDKGPFTFGYAYMGKLKSAFAGKPIPEGVPGVPAGANATSGEHAGVLQQSQKDVRLMVVGDADLASDEYARIFLQAPQFVPAYGKNLHFVINTVDWMAEDETLIQLRSKQVSARLLTTKKEWAPTVARLANNVLLPLAFIGYGVVRWTSRKSRRRRAKIDA